MPEALKIEISRIWTQSWTSLAKLNATSAIYGDLTVFVGSNLLPGFDVKSEGGAELHKAARELFKLRNFPEGELYVATFRHIPDVEYPLERRGDVLFLSARKPGARKPIKGLEALELACPQVAEELTKFRSQLRALLLANCSPEAAAAWWHLHAPGKIDED